MCLHQRRFKHLKKKSLYPHAVALTPMYGLIKVPTFTSTAWTNQPDLHSASPGDLETDLRTVMVPPYLSNNARPAKNFLHLLFIFRVSNLHERFKSGVNTAWDFSLTHSLPCTHNIHQCWHEDRIEKRVRAQMPQLQSTIMTVNKESAAKNLQILKSPSRLWISGIQ